MRALARSVPLRPQPVSPSPIASWAKAWIAVILAASAGGLFVGIERAVMLLAAVGFAGALAGLRWRPLGLLSLGVLCTLDPMVRLLLKSEGLVRFNSLNYFLLLALLLNSKTLLQWRNGQLRLLVVLIVALTLGLLFSSGREAGVQHLFNLVSLLGVLVYVRRAGSNPQNWFWLGAVSGLAAVCFGVLFFLQRESIDYVNSNAWAYMPLTGLFAVCLGAAAGRPRRKGAVALTLLAVANVMWVVLSGSRGGMLVALVCVAFLAVTLKGGAVRAAALAAGAVAVIAMATFFLDDTRYTLEKVDTLFDSTKSSSKRTDGHMDLAIGGWYVFLDHPLGVGTGGFAPTWSELGSRANVPMFKYGREMQAHSAWVKTLAENGVLGFLCLAAYVSSFAFVGWRSGRAAAFRFGVFVTMAMAMAFLASEFAAKGLWLLAAGATVLLDSHREARGTRRRAETGRNPQAGRLEPNVAPTARRLRSIRSW
jgi:MFS family permease